MNRRKLFSKLAAISAGTLLSSLGTAQANQDRQIDISEIDGMEIPFEIKCGRIILADKVKLRPELDNIKFFDTEEEAQEYYSNIEGLRATLQTSNNQFICMPVEIQFINN